MNLHKYYTTTKHETKWRRIIEEEDYEIPLIIKKV